MNHNNDWTLGIWTSIIGSSAISLPPILSLEDALDSPFEAKDS